MKFLLSLAIAFVSAPASIVMAQDQRVELWSGLLEGMSPEEAAIILRAKAGIQSVSVEQKAGKAKLQIKYVGQGVSVAGKLSKFDLEFVNARLQSLKIFATAGFGLRDCLSDGRVAYAYYSELLSQKYERNSVSRPQFDDRLVAELKINRLSSGKPSLPVYEASEGFTDGKVQIFNMVTFRAAPDKSFSYNSCRDDAGIRASQSLLYISKSFADAAMKSERVLSKTKSDEL